MRRLTLMMAVIAAVSTTVAAPASSHYTKLTDVRVPMSDGVVLTSDVYIPTVTDADADGLYPCVVELTPYRKESRYSEGASFLPHQGIALIEVDARGTGGSGGEYDIVFSVREQADAAEWVEWAATAAKKGDGSPLCEPTVGMYGGSYSGIIQYLVASLPATRQGDVPAAPPHLAAIAPQRAYGDLYRDIVYHGGMVIGSFGTIWSSGTSAYYTQPPTDVHTPAGSDAWLDHLSSNDPMMAPYLANPYADASYTSDDTVPPYTQKLYEDSSVLSRIENLRVPTLHLAGWFDSFTRGQLETFRRAHELEIAYGDRGPNHLIVGPWNHTGTHFITPDQGFRDELRDWYLYWLEARANEAPAPAWIEAPERVQYFQMRSGVINAMGAADGDWRTSFTWPPSELDAQRLYLREGGRLLPNAPDVAGGDLLVSDPSSGNAEILSRWDNAAGTPHPQWDQRREGPKGLTYQTDALPTDVSIGGPIALNLYATVSSPELPPPPTEQPGVAQQFPPHNDVDIVVKLSDVAPDGTATLVTQGYLRASHRAVDPLQSYFADFEMLAPYHPHTRAALRPPSSDEPTWLPIEVWPTAKTFAAGHRIRIDVYTADTPNHLTILKPSVSTVHRGPSHASYLTMPVIQAAG